MKKLVIVLVVLLGVIFFLLQGKQNKEGGTFFEEFFANEKKESVKEKEAKQNNNSKPEQEEKEEETSEEVDDIDPSAETDEIEELMEERQEGNSAEEAEESDNTVNAKQKNKNISGENNEDSILSGIEFEGKNLWGRETAATAIKDLEESGILLDKDVTGYLAHYYEPDRYEIGAKQNRQFIGLYLKDEDGKAYEGVYKALALNDESVLYVLSAYTNYFENGKSTKNLEYEFEVPLQGEYYEEVESGTILIADDTIYVFMAEDDSKLDHFVNIFKKSKDITGTFDEYLQTAEAKSLLADINTRFETQLGLIKQYDQKVPQSFKNAGLSMWDAFITLDMAGLNKYYADEVWFYASADEWFNDAKKEGVYDPKQFYLLEREELLSSYQELKTEEHEELLPLMRDIKKDITFYYVEDLMELCDGEDKQEFPNYIKAQDGDVVMFVEMGPGNNNICSINGKFSFNEKYFWLLRNIDGAIKVVTDYNE